MRIPSGNFRVAAGFSVCSVLKSHGSIHFLQLFQKFKQPLGKVPVVERIAKGSVQDEITAVHSGIRMNRVNEVSTMACHEYYTSQHAFIYPQLRTPLYKDVFSGFSLWGKVTSK